MTWHCWRAHWRACSCAPCLHGPLHCWTPWSTLLEYSTRQPCPADPALQLHPPSQQAYSTPLPSLLHQHPQALPLRVCLCSLLTTCSSLPPPSRRRNLQRRHPLPLVNRGYQLLLSAPFLAPPGLRPQDVKYPLLHRSPTNKPRSSSPPLLSMKLWSRCAGRSCACASSHAHHY